MREILSLSHGEWIWVQKKKGRVGWDGRARMMGQVLEVIPALDLYDVRVLVRYEGEGPDLETPDLEVKEALGLIEWERDMGLGARRGNGSAMWD